MKLNHSERGFLLHMMASTTLLSPYFVPVLFDYPDALGLTAAIFGVAVLIDNRNNLTKQEK